MGIFPGLPDPTLKVAKGVLTINGEGKEDSTNSFIERTHDSPKGFLPGLTRDIFYSIPDLQFDLELLINVDGLRGELNSDSHVILVSELALNILGQHGSLTHT